MMKLAFALTLFVVSVLPLGAQEQPTAQQPDESVSLTYRQTDEVRNELGLDYKQFEKVYKAYKKYNDAVYGTERMPRQGAQAGGRRPGGHGGRGGHGGGGRQNFGGGHPPMGDSGVRPQPGSLRKNVDPEKLEETKVKQEEKLRKSMKKLLKDDGDYNRWLQIRERQLSAPPRPATPPSQPVVK